MRNRVAGQACRCIDKTLARRTATDCPSKVSITRVNRPGNSCAPGQAIAYAQARRCARAAVAQGNGEADLRTGVDTGIVSDIAN